MTRDDIKEKLFSLTPSVKFVDVGIIADWISLTFVEKEKVREIISENKICPPMGYRPENCHASVDNCKRCVERFHKKLKGKTAKPTIQKLESILDSDEDAPIEILPNGEIREKGQTSSGKKPLTMQEDLGGEYTCRKGKMCKVADTGYETKCKRCGVHLRINRGEIERDICHTCVHKELTTLEAENARLRKGVEEIEKYTLREIYECEDSKFDYDKGMGAGYRNVRKRLRALLGKKP